VKTAFGMTGERVEPPERARDGQGPLRFLTSE